MWLETLNYVLGEMPYSPESTAPFDFVQVRLAPGTCCISTFHVLCH